MDTYLLPLSIALIAYGVFQLILLVKLWNMTEDIRLIRVLLVKKDEDKIKDTSLVFAINDLVYRKGDRKQMRIVGIEDGKYRGATASGTVDEGLYESDEIELLK